MDIEVKRDGKNVVFTLRADSAAKNIRLFRHTVDFVNALRE